MSNTKLVPTWQGYIGSTLDALIIIQHILDKKIEPVSRRPHERERPTLIKSGNVFVFIEEYSGIKRWTDGVTWSPSRVLGKFLAYRKMDDDSIQQKGIKKKKKTAKLASKSDGSQADKHSRGISKVIAPHCEVSMSQNLVKTLPHLQAYKTAPIDQNSHVKLPYSHNSSRGGKYFDQDLIKKSLSLTTTSKELHLEGLEEKQTIHLVSYYTHDDVTNGRLVQPSKEGKPWNINPSLWDAIKETSLGGKIPIEDEAYYYLDTKYQLQRMDLQKTQLGTAYNNTSLIPAPLAAYGTLHQRDKPGSSASSKHEALPVIGRQKYPNRTYNSPQQGMEYGIGCGQNSMGYAQTHQGNVSAMINGQDHALGQGYHGANSQNSAPGNYSDSPFRRETQNAFMESGGKREEELVNAGHSISNAGYNLDMTFMSQFSGVCFALSEIPDALVNTSQPHTSHYGTQQHHLQLHHYALSIGSQGPHISESNMAYYPQISQHDQQQQQQLAITPYAQQSQRYLPEYDVITKPYYAATDHENHAAEANSNGRQKSYHFVETLHPEQYPLMAGQFNTQVSAATQPIGGGGGMSSGALSTSESTAPTVAYDAAWSNTANKQNKHHINTTATVISNSSKS